MISKTLGLRLRVLLLRVEQFPVTTEICVDGCSGPSEQAVATLI